MQVTHRVTVAQIGVTQSVTDGLALAGKPET
jgi:hypothetical protein